MLWTCVALLVGLLGPAGALADADVLDDQRHLYVRNETCTSPCPVELTKTPIVPGAPFSDIISGFPFTGWSSSQLSTISPDLFEGVGFTDTFTSLGQGRSVYDVTFDLAEDHGFDLTGAIEAEGNAGALALLTDEGTGLPVFLLVAGPLAGGPLNQPLDETGILPAGTYRLQIEGVVSSSPTQGGDADWDFALALPEPSHAAQLLAGLLTLAAVHHTRRC